MKRFTLMALAAAALSAFAVGQVATDGGYQVRYAANLDLQDAVVNMTNTGAINAADICVNTYTFAYDEQLISCCTCKLTRNSLCSLSANTDLIANTLTPLGDIARRGIVIKLVTSLPVAGACDAANPVTP